ncbi:MAG: NAD(P)/FAD-dependent oxidoreductase [Candidatus Nanosalina sp.]
MAKEEVLILGAGFLGVNAAMELDDSGYEVTLIDDGLSHEYIPATIDLIRGRAEARDLELDLEEYFSEEVELIDDRVNEIRPEEKVVETRKGLHGYDQLVIGLGGEPRTFDMDVSEAHDIWTLENTEKLVEELEEAEKAVVVGAGCLGIEAAGEIAEKGVETVIVDGKTRPAPRLTERSSEKVLEIFEKKRISFRGGKKAEDVSARSVVLEDGEKIEADAIVWSGGVKASEVVQESFDTGHRGAEVNKGLSAVGYEDVFVGGDCADTGHMKLARNAMHEAEVIAENIRKDEGPLEEAEDSSIMIAGIGDTGAVIYGDSIVSTGRHARIMKDLVRKYYFLRLKWKKLKSKYL